MKEAAAHFHARRSLHLLAAVSLAIVALAATSAGAARPSIVLTTTTPANASTVSGSVGWQVSASGGTPSRVDFAVDGSVIWSRTSAPYGGTLDTTTLSNGQHTLTATAPANQGNGSGNAATTSVTITVSNSAASATAPTVTSAPTISGTPIVGQTLSALAGSWAGATPITVGYQWTRCNSSGAGCTAITRATTSSYTAQSADVGATLRVSVVATNFAGSSVATSAATALVATTVAVTTSYAFGTLNTLTTNASQEVAAGINTAEVDVGWDLYEPKDGIFDSSYGSSVAKRVQALQAAGYKVVLGLGLHYPPSWVFGYSGSQLVNQYGGTGGEVNLIFNQTLRQKAAALIGRLNQDVGLNSFYAIRITSGGDVEAMYPPEDADGVHSDGYWAYGQSAQTGANLPPTIPVNPFPGWKPGQRTYNGLSFTTAQVQQWYAWYLNALVDAVNWQIQTYKSFGYKGYLQVLTPGVGSRPDEYQAAINNYLDRTGDTNATMGRGAVWNKWYDALPDKANIVAYVSSMADGSGNPANNPCQASDSAVSVTDPQVDGWSATRWISYIAKRYSLPTSGENPGGGAGYGLTMLQTAAKQMQACGMQGMYWAHDANLYDGVSRVTLSDYATLIAQYR